MTGIKSSRQAPFTTSAIYGAHDQNIHVIFEENSHVFVPVWRPVALAAVVQRYAGYGTPRTA